MSVFAITVSAGSTLAPQTTGELMTAVLITLCDGTVDYCTDKAAGLQVVFVDLDRHNIDTSFPDDVDVDIAALRQLPSEMPWAGEMIRRLAAIRTQIREHIYSQAPPDDDDNDDLLEIEGT